MQRVLALSLTACAALVCSTPVLADDGASNDETRAVIAEMLADAETRSSMLSGSAGHDGKFFISDGENFRLNISGQMQFRYNLVFGDQLDNTPDRGFESGFQLRRTRLQFDGFIYDPALYYRVKMDFSRSSGQSVLLDAFAGYKFDNGWAVQWGQFKAPFNREELVSSKYQLAVDRSLTNAVFNLGRVQGVMAKYKAEEFQAAVMFSDGSRSLNTDFNSLENSGSVFQGAQSGGTADYAVTARGEFKLAGEWDQFKQFTSMPGSEFGAMLGVAGHVEGTGEDRIVPGPPATDSNTLFAWTVDASVVGDGWNAFAAFTGYHSDNLASYSDYGWVIQGGWYLPDSDWELFGRWDQIIPDNDSGARGLTTGKSFNTLSLGTNYYMHGQASKFTFQFMWFLNGDPGLIGTSTGTPWLSNGNEENEFAFVFQWQLLF